MEPFLGQVVQMGFDWAPQDHAKCDGATIEITQNPGLYSLIGIQFGGTTTNFKLPDLRGRTPIGSSPTSSYLQGTMLGAETVTLTAATMPVHTHPMVVAEIDGDYPLPADITDPTKGKIFADAVLSNDQSPAFVYGPATNLISLNPASSTTVGGGQAHYNLQPSQVICYVIALSGLYPQRP